MPKFETVKRAFFLSVLAILGLQVAFFLVSRLTIFVKQYNTLSKQREHDMYVVDSICSLSSVRHKMGTHVDLCIEAEERLQHTLIAQAMEYVIDNTHICGSTPCLDIFSDVAAILSQFYMLALIPLAYYVYSLAASRLGSATRAATILKEDIMLPQCSAIRDGSASFDHIKFD